MNATARFTVLLSCLCLAVGLVVGAALMRYTADGWRGVLTVVAVLLLSTGATLARAGR